MSELREKRENSDIIGITESWANEVINDAELSIDGFNMFRRDRKCSRGGGVILYVKINLEASLSEIMKDDKFEESLWCNIKLKDSNMLVGVCYRSPSSDQNNDIQLLELLDKAIIRSKHDHVLIMGDFNFPEIDYNIDHVEAGESAAPSLFFQKTQELCLYQFVSEPTRVRKDQKPSTLDYIFMDEFNLIDQVEYNPPIGKSDHVVLEWDIKLTSDDMISSKRKLDYWKGDYHAVTEQLQKVDWCREFNGKTVNEIWIIFKELLLKNVMENVPEKQDNRKKNGKWLSKVTLKRMKERNTAWKKYRQFKSGKNFEEYRSLRNEVTTKIRNDEDHNRKLLLQGFKGNPKRFYGYMRGMQTVKENVASLSKEDGKLTESDQESADLLATYFETVFTREDTREMPEVEEKNLNWQDTKMEFSKETVLRKLKKLQVDKSPGPDSIHPLVLKECSEAIAEPLSLIFQKSFEASVLPDEWKNANVVPIYKKGPKTDKANYRPVSLTSIPCKIMESIVKDRILEFLEDNDSLNQAQHGFMKGRSCLTNLLETLEMWTKTLDEGYGLDVVYLDYRKAFDSVPHKRLVAKLRMYGLTGKLLLWIADFLNARTMKVELRGVFSRLIEVLSGVPQGSVLGPLLFLLYVNELPNWIKNNIRMFADDTKIWRKIRSEEDSESLQNDLDKLEEWSDKWMLKFNTAKCKVMHIGHKLDTKYWMGKSVNRMELETIEEEKDLGVFIRSDLKSSTQCVKSAARARRIVGMIRRNFRKLDKEDFLLLYKTYVRPHLEYCVQAWSPHMIKDIAVLERVQKAATNLVPCLKKYNYEERLRRLGIPSLQRRRERGDMIETYKILSEKENISSEQFFVMPDNIYSLRGHNKKIKKNCVRLDIRKYFYSQRVVNHWNRLSQKVVDATSVNGFKNALDKEWEDMDARSCQA
jgi:Reverse transcriptase (RNA-dependent DNA polymerase)/Endonuclease-reverse transcriptase